MAFCTSLKSVKKNVENLVHRLVHLARTLAKFFKRGKMEDLKKIYYSPETGYVGINQLQRRLREKGIKLSQQRTSKVSPTGIDVHIAQACQTQVSDTQGICKWIGRSMAGGPC